MLSTAIEGGNPPDLAALPNPGLMRDFVERGALKDIEFARETVEENFAESWVDLASVDDTLYGIFFKGANKSTVWYNVHAYEDAGIEPAEDWEAFLQNAETHEAVGHPDVVDRRRRRLDPHRLVRELYLRMAGPEKYDQLSNHEIPWTDPSVMEALTELQKVFGDTDNIAGGTNGALQTNFPESVSQVFQETAQGRDGLRGRLRRRRHHRRDAGAGRNRLQRLRLPVGERLRRRPWSAAAT